MIATDVPGPIRFARYAYGPNRLGYCSRTPPTSSSERPLPAAISGASASSPRASRALRHLSTSSPARTASPIRSTGGSSRRTGSAATSSTRSRRRTSRARTRRASGRASGRPRTGAGSPEAGRGAHPTTPSTSSMSSRSSGCCVTGRSDDVLGLSRSCRIRSGSCATGCRRSTSSSTRPARMGVTVTYRAGHPRPQTVRRWLDGPGSSDVEPVPGDVVAIHWDWACERLDARQVARSAPGRPGAGDREPDDLTGRDRRQGRSSAAAPFGWPQPARLAQSSWTARRDAGRLDRSSVQSVGCSCRSAGAAS